MKQSLQVFKKLLPTAVFMLFAYALQAQEAVSELNTLYTDQIRPIINTVLTIVIVIAVAWCAIMMFMGKKQGAVIAGFILLGALLFRLFPKILNAIMELPG